MLRRVVGALVSGGVLCLAFPTFDVWVAAPVSLALLALVITGVRPRAGFGLGFLAGLAFFLPTLHWAGVYVGNLPWIALAALQALFFGLVGVLYAWLSRPGHSGTVRPVAFAVVWVVVEGLRARAPYGGFPWVKLAFSQADSPFGHLASLGGAPFVGFALALAGALLAVVASRALGRMPLSSLALPAALAVGLALSGLLVPLPTEGPTAQFVGVQGNVPRPGLDFNAERRAVLDNHVNATLAAAGEGAGGQPTPDLYVWPENASDIDPLRNLDANQLIRNTVDRIGVPLIVGGLLEEPEGYVSNVSLLFEPGKGETDRYVKRHPVPFGEYIPNRAFWRLFSDQVDLVRRDFYPGSEVGLFTVPTASGQTIRTGLSICFEVAYDDIMRDVVDAGANVLVVQTNNATFGYTAESPQQLAISRLRAMEFGRSVVHVSTVGQSALITPDGTAHQVTSLFTRAVVRGDLPLRDSKTLATRLGEGPEWAALLALIVMLGLRQRWNAPGRMRVDSTRGRDGVRHGGASDGRVRPYDD
ncbi:MAG TPA: apolipoprotein N-acyltransferase [Intrasporangium sp.]|uniref:apolipoprotein N-acyltransferase n=1 Tax=Intrasporangium sp. TaxID=1925024 RepID=UPI002B4A65F0|nr:apolipoprotein N-acyltransferase [Intrasporangium sp.]HKX68895.1 apolipoprotein N-acyltransferase [Intrasporangium sp.]